MNIAKQKEIITLRKEQEELQASFNTQTESLLNAKIPELLDEATKLFVEYLQKEGFKVTEISSELLRADLNGELPIDFNRKPRIITVKMPNGESYSVTVTSNISDSGGTFSSMGGTEDDREIAMLKQKIAHYNKLLLSLENSEFYYKLTTEGYDDYRKEMTFDSKRYSSFHLILKEMFS